jgi:hypothetical protein
MKENEVFENAAVVEGLRYADSKRYKRYSTKAFDMFERLHGKSPDTFFRSMMGHQLRQFDAHRYAMKTEGVSQASIPILRDYGFELITALFPGLIANDIFNVQPAKYKNYSIFYQNYLHTNAKGQTAANSRMIGSLLKDQIDTDYTSDSEVDKIVTVAGGGTSQYTVAAAGTLYRPLIPGTVVVTAVRTSNSAVMTAVDDGVSAMIGDVQAGTNTVDFVTGEIHVNFAEAVKINTQILLTYTFLGEGSEANAAEMDMTISEIQGSAKEHRLRFNYTIESQYAYRQQFGRSMDADMLAAAIADVRAEIDGDLIKAGFTAASVQTGQNASAGYVEWDRTPDAGVQYFYWREQFIDALHSMGNLIIDAAGFGEGNKVIGGLNFKQVVETIGPRVKLDNVPATAKGARKVGTIDGVLDCYYSPLLGADDFYVTYKGGPLQVGLSYNPWMPLYTSEPHMLDNGKLHRYLITSYGKVMVNRKLFVQGHLKKS